MLGKVILGGLAAIVVLIATLVGAFAWMGRERPVDWFRDMPWAAPGERVRLSAKSENWFSDGKTMIWRDARGERIDQVALFQSVGDFFARRGMPEGWPFIQRVTSFPDDYDGYAAPFGFTIVSVMPTIVVMHPDPAWPELSRKSVETESSGREPTLQERGTRHLTNPILFGTVVRGEGPLQWFSPDLDRPPAPVTVRSPDEGEIALPHGMLLLRRGADGWRVERR